VQGCPLLPPQTFSGGDVSAPIWGAETSPPETTTTNGGKKSGRWYRKQSGRWYLFGYHLPLCFLPFVVVAEDIAAPIWGAAMSSATTTNKPFWVPLFFLYTYPFFFRVCGGSRGHLCTYLGAEMSSATTTNKSPERTSLHLFGVQIRPLQR
jgi:hypothetical protein